jgi:nitroreductase
MTPVPPSLLVEQLKWRYATKKFDPAKKIPDATWAALEQALVLTPSSFGLQPWKFVVVSDPELCARLSIASWGQPQPVDCSHFVVFARRTDLPESEIDRHVGRMSALTGIATEGLTAYRGVMASFRQQAEAEGWINPWADRQVYIALGNFMTAAALLGVDACPMEGIEPAQYDEILELTGSGYATVVACAAGYRAADDASATRPKIRYDADEVVVHR